MAFIAAPIRLQGGLLKRCDEFEAIRALVQAMARTPSGSWKVSPHFGVRDFLVDSRRRPRPMQTLVAELNLTLQDLSITRYRVEAATREVPGQRDVDSYVLTLVPVEGGKRQDFDIRA
jgi:hypothetical protein